MDLKVENGSIEEDKGIGWGKSLPVQSVQEIVRNDPQSVPERYIQETKDRPLISNTLPSSLEIPIIDFSLLAKGDEDERRKLDLACKDWGFFQIVNHGVAEEVLQKMKEAVRAFFELPHEEKKKYAMAENDLHGYGQAYVHSEDQKLDWCDLIALFTLPPEVKKFKFWPLTIPVEVYSIEVQKVIEEINANLSLLMGMDRDGLEKLQGKLKQMLKLNYYPPCLEPDLVLGISPHSDGGTLTLLLQDDEVTGLQIKHKDQWISVKPIPNSLVLNVGDVIEILSNGMYKSIEHRAVTNEKKSRISVAAFAFPEDEVEVGPVDSMVDDQNRPRMYRNVKYIDYVRHHLGRKMEEGKVHTDFVNIKEDKGIGWGKSLPVQSVQEIVRNDPQSVPERYIQETKDRPLISNTLPSSLEIPIIDFSLLAKGDEDERRKLDLACKDWGFFQIINHGVAEEVLQKMKEAVRAFFELPLEEKKKYAMAENDLHGYGQAYVLSEDQKLDWCDIIVLFTLPPEIKRFKFWPLTIPGFKESVELFSTEVQKVIEEINANLSLLMGMDRDGLEKLQGKLKQGLRMNYYPPCLKPDLVLGISPHSDGGTLTLLLQDDEITGLQIKHKDDWIPVKPIPNSLVMNVGDVIEILSNGMYKSIEHRAVTNEKNSRISVAVFAFPEDEVEVSPVDSMVDDQNRPRMYRNVKYIDYVRHHLGGKMEEGKVHTDFVKLESNY
ncbi:Oxoglutarate/iron-dependent dioxygenase [Corchorus olitorius]|uniref:Oxoglutarate/iron-dependent dioxygenase n=1 Tax=Corchorus olitorius TaxID=93759 RepID=A0A1R3KMT2_9ROSI|nr:Oxoglutarate/iron-dependent dioxygenase [Corchorus olitorius]